MSELKATPGPWEVRGDGYSAQVFSVEGGLVASPTGDAETRPANAHLIASAPALYEALDALDTFCRSGEGNADEPLNKAGDALKQARGEA